MDRIFTLISYFFHPVQAFFCSRCLPLAPFKSTSPQSKQEKGWKAEACPVVELSRVSFTVIAKFCDLNSGYLRKEHRFLLHDYMD